MSSPQDIQDDIERTRAKLSGDVDRLSEKVSPGKVVGRQVDTVKTRAGALRERVMGSGSDAAGSISDRASDLAGTVGNAPQQVREQAQGNPLAVGLIAFGVGWLVSSLAPASSAEQQVAGQVEAKAREAVEPLKQAGQEVAQNLQPQLKEAAEQVKSVATDAAQETADTAKHSAQQAKDDISSS